MTLTDVSTTVFMSLVSLGGLIVRVRVVPRRTVVGDIDRCFDNGIYVSAK